MKAICLKKIKGNIGSNALMPKNFVLCENPLPDLAISYLFNDKWTSEQFDRAIFELYTIPSNNLRLLINLTTPYFCESKVSRVTWKGT